MKVHTTLRALPRSTCRTAQILLRGASRRSICMDRVMRSLRDGLAVANGVGETLVGRPLATLIQNELRGPAAAIQRSLHSSRIAVLDLSKTLAAWRIEPPRPPTTDLATPSPPPEHLRSVMRLLAQSVVVCTAKAPDGAPRAMTMSSFTSLTLAPTPVVTFNVATPSRTFDAIAATREFNIHILSGDAAGASVADHFTRGNLGDDVFDGLEGAAVQDGQDAPVLAGQGVLHVLRCKVLDDAPENGLIRIRDHVVVAGEVVEMMAGAEAKDFGLAYADRKYRQIGGVIAKE